MVRLDFLFAPVMVSLNSVRLAARGTDAADRALRERRERRGRARRTGSRDATLHGARGNVEAAVAQRRRGAREVADERHRRGDGLMSQRRDVHGDGKCSPRCRDRACSGCAGIHGNGQDVDFALSDSPMFDVSRLATLRGEDRERCYGNGEGAESTHAGGTLREGDRTAQSAHVIVPELTNRTDPFAPPAPLTNDPCRCHPP